MRDFLTPRGLYYISACTITSGKQRKIKWNLTKSETKQRDRHRKYVISDVDVRKRREYITKYVVNVHVIHPVYVVRRPLEHKVTIKVEAKIHARKNGDYTGTSCISRIKICIFTKRVYKSERS